MEDLKKYSDALEKNYNLMYHNADTLLNIVNTINDIATQAEGDSAEVIKLKVRILAVISRDLRKLLNPAVN